MDNYNRRVHTSTPPSQNTHLVVMAYHKQEQDNGINPGTGKRKMDTLKDPVTWIVGTMTAVSGFVIRHSFGTRKALHDHKIFAAENFQTKGDSNRAIDGITNILNRIETKLDGHIAKDKD